jgi:hypothetical protein
MLEVADRAQERRSLVRESRHNHIHTTLVLLGG